MNSTDAGAVLTAAQIVNTTISAAKQAIELAKQTKNPDLKEKLSELFDHVLEIKAKMLVLEEENGSLKREKAAKASVHRKGQFGYFFVEGDPDPLCPHCFEKDDKQIHLPALHEWNGGLRRLCRSCHNEFWERPASEGAAFATYSDGDPNGWMR
jgi:hypothetical protein